MPRRVVGARLAPDTCGIARRGTSDPHGIGFRPIPCAPRRQVAPDSTRSGTAPTAPRGLAATDVAVLVHKPFGPCYSIPVAHDPGAVPRSCRDHARRGGGVADGSARRHDRRARATLPLPTGRRPTADP